LSLFWLFKRLHQLRKFLCFKRNALCDNLYQFIFAETPQSVEKQDFFFKDFIHGTIITGSWINEVGEFAES